MTKQGTHSARPAPVDRSCNLDPDRERTNPDHLSSKCMTTPTGTRRTHGKTTRPVAYLT